MCKWHKKLKTLHFKTLTVAFLAFPCHAQTQDDSQPATYLGTAQDCTQVSVDYADDPNLTDAEKLVLMDRALFQSLSRYDACANMPAISSGGGGGGVGSGGGGSGGGGAAGGNGSGQGSGTFANAQGSQGMGTASDLTGTEAATGEPASSSASGHSVASTDMVGTEKPKRDPGEGDGLIQTKADVSGDVPVDGSDVEDGAYQQDAGMIDNGKVPDDIPPADNDSVLEAQIRQAAINETDPEIKAKLWDEYRRYKGLPTKN